MLLSLMKFEEATTRLFTRAPVVYAYEHRGTLANTGITYGPHPEVVYL